MLKKILNEKICAGCKVCCVFDRYDVWETPVLTPSVAEEICHLNPDTEFYKNGNTYNFKIKNLDEAELFYCPMLNKSTGCILGDSKPFDCKIWPYRIMDFNGSKVITISPICNELFNRPLSEIVRFLKDELLNNILNYANVYPEAVKPYDKMYPIIYVAD